jgi:hypothetical protein
MHVSRGAQDAYLVADARIDFSGQGAQRAERRAQRQSRGRNRMPNRKTSRK